jgi:Xaa-Pro aminopeptidase
MTKVPLSELTDRMKRFRARMDAENPNWELAAFFGRVNQYYFTGTMQDGVLLVPRDGEAVFWVRRSFERAGDESLFPDIRPMKSFRDATPSVPAATARQVIHIETELVPPGCGRSRVRTSWPSWNGAAPCTAASWKRTCRRCCARE